MNATGAARVTRIAALVVTLTACACHDAPPEGWDRPADSTLRIMHIDVGQGDATLLLGPDGTAMLVDAGSAEVGARPSRCVKRVLARRICRRESMT